MLPFIYGFILALALAVPAFVLFCRSRSRRAREQSDDKGQQIAELSKLTGGLAHEIRNPLSTIKVNLKLISEDMAGGDQKSARNLKKISVVQTETDRLEQILDDFLRYIGRSELNTRDTDINALISDMVDFFSPQAHSHNITIHLGLTDKFPVCKIDADMIKQVILNLFINAQQAMPNGGELIIRTDMHKKNATIEISDTGEGIGPGKIDKIFQAYYTSKPGGSGLGLPSAKKIINAHKGTITVNSQPGRGTSFKITLPVQV